MKKTCLFIIVLLLMPLEAKASSILGGYTSPAPFRVISVLSDRTPDKGEFAVGFSIEQSGSPDFYRYVTRVAVGVWENLEFGVNIPYYDGSPGSSASSQNSSSSFENLTLGAKHRVLDENSHNFSGAYLVTVSIPVKEDANSTDGGAGGGVIFSKRVGPVLGHFNLLYNRQLDEDLENTWSAGFGVEFSAARGLKILAELYGMKNDGSDDDNYISEARFAYRFEDKDVLNSMVGVGVGLTDESSSYRFFASVSMVLHHQGVRQNTRSSRVSR